MQLIDYGPSVQLSDRSQATAQIKNEHQTGTIYRNRPT